MMSGDFIVGFPEETEADFQATMDLVEEVNYGYAYSFQILYPSRHACSCAPASGRGRGGRAFATLASADHTPAACHPGEHGRARRERAGGKSRPRGGQMLGKSEYLHSVHINNSTAQIGEVVPVRITRAMTNSLTAEQG